MSFNKGDRIRLRFGTHYGTITSMLDNTTCIVMWDYYHDKDTLQQVESTIDLINVRELREDKLKRILK